MKILGLDISTKTGFAVLEDGKLTHYGLIREQIVHNDDYSLVKTALNLATKIGKEIDTLSPDAIVIEQTNPGRFKVQKLLEFLHMATLLELQKKGYEGRVFYLDSSRWRSLIKMRLSDDQKKHNKRVKQHLARGKVTSKHLSVQWVNSFFSQEFKLKDNDICDSICLSYAYFLQTQKKPVEKNINIDEILGIT